jgi:hypothetical protein
MICRPDVVVFHLQTLPIENLGSRAFRFLVVVSREGNGRLAFDRVWPIEPPVGFFGFWMRTN